MRSSTVIPCLAVFIAVLTIVNPNVRAQSPLVTIDTVPVGNPGNAASPANRGAVAYGFAIGKYEVTIGQYTTFLNSVASVTSDSYIINLWNASMASDLSIAGISRSGSGTLASPYSYSAIGSSSRPIAYVSWFDAARFSNWVNNGATNGASTETGAYTLNSATSGVITKNAGAAWWIPSDNEWYKAAYYDVDRFGANAAGYWTYPTKSALASTPGNTIGGATNQANYKAQQPNGTSIYTTTRSETYSSTANYLTDVGAFSNSASAYGTFDQGGSLEEWNDRVRTFDGYRGVHGGSWAGTAYEMDNGSGPMALSPTTETKTLGFRVATVPEPSTCASLLAGLAFGGYTMLRRCKQA